MNQRIPIPFPLVWPAEWPRREGGRAQRRFMTDSLNAALELKSELRLLGGTDIVISTNAPDVLREPVVAVPDPGVAVYFTWKGKSLVMAHDEYRHLSDNLHTLVLAIRHLRGLRRHGGGRMMEMAMVGFVQPHAQTPNLELV